MEPWHLLILVATGAVAGFMNVMAAGGSMLTVPMLVFLGLPGPIANGTNRIAIVAQSVAAAYTFFRKGFSDFKLSLTLALCAVPGAVLGALIGVQLRGVWFNRVLAIVMITMLLVMWLRKPPMLKENGGKVEITRARLITGHLLMVGVGMYGGFIQIGVGFLLLPVLHQVLGLGLVRVNMHKVFIAGTFNLAALIVYASQVPLVWVFGLSLAVGNSIGGWLGAHTSVTKGEHAIKWVLNGVAIVFIIKLLWS